jgi:hypothetical protein
MTTTTDTQREYRVTPDHRRLIFEDGTELSVVDVDTPFANTIINHIPDDLFAWV